ncbi:signal peptidase I [Kamptonema animale CS-326]|jgi:signal peptidase I|uniref:signal peptidase I n=1 Tax=Kamptonema animale TaxID=92934 RepID=UPI002330902A|nr:signal peptidase I [Kamptonema animale]MDB9511534.1 signal peptidase I [Kamptonema animale CS-326]
MSKKQNPLYWFACLMLGTMAFVLCPYFVNQIPGLGSLLKDVPPIIIGFGAFLVAIFFAAISIIAPQLLTLGEVSSEDLWREFWAKNQETINQRLKNSLDQGCHIDVINKDSPADLARSQTQVQTVSPSENPQSQSPFGKGWRNWFKGLQSPPILSGIMATLPRIEARRELQNLQTAEITNLAASKPILEIFEEANRRLLILGEPGSGKTTELLKLAQALGEAAEKDPKQPIPVIFELSVWRGEPMLDWMTEEMEARYGLKREVCREWLLGDRIVPLLDGLDELGKNKAKEAILAIDALQEHYEQQQKALVICCRSEDYESIKDDENQRVRLRKVDRAVRLCELNDAQIEDYLRQRQATHIWEELESNRGFKQLAKSPMLLNLMPIAYPKGLPENAPLHPDVCQKRLFEDFLARKLQPTQQVSEPPLKDYDSQKARHYLAWLAASMGREGINQREFLIEGLQPIWLENQRQFKQYRLIVGMILGLIVGLIVGLIGGPIGGLILGLHIGLIILLIGGCESIELTENFDISWRGIKRGLSLGLRQWMIFGIFFWLIFGLSLWWSIESIFELILVIIFGLIFGLILGIILGIISGLIQGLKIDLKVRKYPNQGIWETRTKTLMMMGLSILLLFLLIVIIPNWPTRQDVNLVKSLMEAGGIGFFWGGFILGGGVALVQHFSLRWVLYRQGQMPWNYAKFLTAVSQAGILKQSGGRFRFYHDKLREYLAQDMAIASYSIPKSQTKWLLLFVLSLPLLLLSISSTNFSTKRIAEIGMKPILQNKDTILTDYITYYFRNFHRGDIIFFKVRNQTDIKYTDTKYLIGQPNETIEIKSGQILINGEEIKIDNIQLPKNFRQGKVTLNADEYYAVVTDPNYTGDDVGLVVPRKNIKGQLVLRLYPFNRVGFL